MLGVGTADIARLFLVPEPTMAARITRAKRKIVTAGIPFAVPSAQDLPERLDVVAQIAYLAFTAGYAPGSGPDAVRTGLAGEAIRLVRVVLSLRPDAPALVALLALMLLQHSRRDTRVDDAGRIVLLPDQDRSRWHHDEVEEAVRLLRSPSLTGPVTIQTAGYAVQARIAAVHATAPSAEATDWERVVAHYDDLVRLTPTPSARLARAVAVAEARGPQDGLAALAGLDTELAAQPPAPRGPGRAAHPRRRRRGRRRGIRAGHRAVRQRRGAHAAHRAAGRPLALTPAALCAPVTHRASRRCVIADGQPVHHRFPVLGRGCGALAGRAKIDDDARPTHRTSRRRPSMPIATPEVYADMLDRAKAGSFAYPAINISSSQTLNAAIRGFAEAGSDGIVQVSTGGAEYLSGSTVKDMVTGSIALAAYAHEVAKKYDVNIALHTDHCPKDKLDGFVRPLLAASAERVKAGGTPWFQSHMWDGSAVPLDENLEIARELLALAKAAHIILEIEVGVVGGEEDGVEGAIDDKLYSTPEDAIATIKALGAGENGRYLTALTFGNVHGVYKPGNVKLRPEILKTAQEAAAGELGLGADARPFDLVFHGGSGSSAEEIAAAVDYGVIKMNVDTDTQYAFTRPVAGYMLANYEGVLKVDGEVGNKKQYDPRAWGKAAEGGMAARVVEACQNLRSAGTHQ